MNSIFLSNNKDTNTNNMINIEELYNRQHKLKLAKESVYLKILGRIHKKIKAASMKHINQKHVFYEIPTLMLNAPGYRTQHCLAFVYNKLKENGFIVNVTPPNILYISWEHYIPYDERKRIEAEYGIKVNEFGEEITAKHEEHDESEDPLMLKMSSDERNKAIQKKQKKQKEEKYNNIEEYKPTGIYGTDLLLSLNKKLGK